MPRPRFRLRTILIAIAISGLMAGFVAAGQRTAYRQQEAYRHYRLAINYENQIRNLPADEICGPIDRKLFSSLRKRFDYHVYLYIKYKDASRHPWLPVPPDPREPA